MILTLRTDKPEAEIGLYDGTTQLAYETWEAHRKLAETIHDKLQQVLQSEQKQWGDISGIVVYQGPGSFTGLRIGISVANALSYSLGIPIAATTGDDWQQSGIQQILTSPQTQPVVPEYGAAPHTTKQKK